MIDPRTIIGRDFRLSIEAADGEFVPIAEVDPAPFAVATSHDRNAAMVTAGLRDQVPPGTPLNNRHQRRAAEARARRRT